MSITETILEQLGGRGRLKLFCGLGPKQILQDDGEGYVILQLNRVPEWRQTHGTFKVQYEPGTDTYTVTCVDGMGNARTREEVYCDELIPFFERETGLYLSLGRRTA